MESLRVQNNPTDKIPFLATKKSIDGKIESIWINILDQSNKEVTNCDQIDLTDIELDNISAVKYSKNKYIDSMSRDFNLLPEGCYLESCYTIGIWYENDLWTMRFFEYRIRWWNKSINGSNVTVEMVSQKFFMGSVLPGDDLAVNQL